MQGFTRSGVENMNSLQLRRRELSDYYIIFCKLFPGIMFLSSTSYGDLTNGHVCHGRQSGP
jgi:hypothetical protein